MTDWSTDVGAGDWIVERLHPFAANVGSLVPEGFEAYTRMPHPRPGSLDPEGLAALVELLETVTRGPCWFGIWDGYGWMSGWPAMAGLAAGPDNPGRLSGGAPAGPRVEIPGRSLALYRAGIEGAAALIEPPTCQSPNLWWPEERAWCVATDIDLPTTYLGGSAALVQRVQRDQRLKAVPASITDRVG